MEAAGGEALPALWAAVEAWTEKCRFGSGGVRVQFSGAWAGRQELQLPG